MNRKHENARVCLVRAMGGILTVMRVELIFLGPRHSLSFPPRALNSGSPNLDVLFLLFDVCWVCCCDGDFGERVLKVVRCIRVLLY